MRAHAYRESSTVDARDELMAIVAHELRHPLAAMRAGRRSSGSAT